MLGRTHAACGLLIGLLVYKYFNANLFLFIGVLIIAALLPDLDEPGSKLGRRVKPMAYVIKFLFGHRTITHNLFFIAAIAFLVWWFFGVYGWALAIGGGSHLLLDGLTKNGVRFLWPLNVKISGFVKTGGLFEKVFFWLLVAGNGWLVFKMLV